jgi:dTDP-4-dehydrorhamnose 3,5-epimerase-like enzyme
MWNDPDINVEWPEIDNPILSEKDTRNLPFKDIELYF